jgi:hypothetical protein
MPIRVAMPDGGIAEFPDDMAPADIEAALGGGEPAVAAGSGRGLAVDAVNSIGPETREGGRLRPSPDETKEAFIDRSIGSWGDATLPGITNVAAPAKGLTRMAIDAVRPRAEQVASKLMRNSLGAQQGIRNKFPTVDLEKVALREGAVPGSSASVSAIHDASKAAGAAIEPAAAAADAAGAAKIQPRQIVTGYRKLYDRAGQARMPEDQADIVKAANDIRHRYRGGINRVDTDVAKQEWAARAKGTLQGAADPRSASLGKKLAKANMQGLAAGAHSDPGVSEALTRSQELMALDKAMTASGNRTSLLRDAMGAAAGTAVGVGTGNPIAGLGTMAVNHLVTGSPALGRAANAISSGGGETTGKLQALLQQLLAMASSHAQE